ncbi:MAG TPA: DUF294 nucleotidyltransferase-like domain-containing protein [Acidimicrobiia bacterium]|nr:DUF294 nucleotidyltransferase-like domain-containing protein [Acidimicrobiia bacterium]
MQTAADLARPVPECPPDTSVMEAARLMSGAGSSAILVRRGDSYGIVTDEDFRRRVVAGGLPGDTPISEVMSGGVHTVTSDRLVEDVVIEMLRTNHHHLPVTDGGRLVGLVSHLDILDAEVLEPFRMVREIAAAGNPVALAEIARDVPASVAATVKAGLTPFRATEVMSLLVDALTRRLLENAQDEVGVPPCAWAWIALGSHGRREQAIATDQDHALIYEDPEMDPYFADLAARVVEGLEACGIPRCESGVMASEPGWRLPPDEWIQRTRRWIMEPALERAFLGEIVFDFRQIAGEFPGEATLGQALEVARRHPPFIHRLAVLAVKHRIPLRRFGGGISAPGGRVDIKDGGLRALTEFGRLFGIQVGCMSSSTKARLQAAAAASVVEPEEASALDEALTVLMEVRLLHQLRRWEKGEPIDEQVRIAELGRIERVRLAQALRAVRSAQQSWEARLATT